MPSNRRKREEERWQWIRQYLSQKLGEDLSKYDRLILFKAPDVPPSTEKLKKWFVHALSQFAYSFKKGLLVYEFFKAGGEDYIYIDDKAYNTAYIFKLSDFVSYWHILHTLVYVRNKAEKPKGDIEVKILVVKDEEGVIFTDNNSNKNKKMKK